MEQIVTGVIYIIIGLVGVILGYVIPKTNAAITAIESNAVLKDWVVYFIKYAEEYISKVGKEKMAWVVNQLADMCRKSNIKITNEQIQVLSEGVYNEISKEVNKIKYVGATE